MKIQMKIKMTLHRTYMHLFNSTFGVLYRTPVGGMMYWRLEEWEAHVKPQDVMETKQYELWLCFFKSCFILNIFNSFENHAHIAE